MGREIKFRGKRVDNGKWVVGFLELHLVDGDLTKTKQDAFITYDYMDKIGKVYRDRFEVIPETVGQFTGLTDLDGYNNEIYEGDICNTHTSLGEGVVVFENGMFKVNGISLCSFREIEVIGNKWDNPELLEAI